VLQPRGDQGLPDLPRYVGVSLFRAEVAGLGSLCRGLTVKPDRRRHGLHRSDEARILDLAALDQLPDLLN
jgi:hypothetical protein